MKMKKAELLAIIRDELERYIKEPGEPGRDDINPGGPTLLDEPGLETEAAREPRSYLYSSERDDGVFPGWSGRRGLKQLARGITEEPKKGRKKNCIPGSPYHSEEGEFTDPSSDKGSWSIAVDGPHSSDCQSGQGRRSSANKSVQITKRRCGRGPGGKGKAKWKCKDGTRSHTPSGELDEEVINQGKQRAIDCRPCWDQFLKALNAANLAAKGDLMKKDK